MRISRLQAFLHLLEQILDLVVDLFLEHRAHLRSTEEGHLQLPASKH